MTKQIVAALAAGITLLSASAGMAQQKPAMHPMAHKPAAKTAAKSVYVCKDCKQYFSPMSAKKMGYKDSMGHTLTKVSKAPAGFSDGSKMKM